MKIGEAFSFFSRPEFMRTFHGWSVIFWMMLWTVAAFAGWLESVTFVSHLSAAALVLGSWSSWQSARVEVKQEENK